MKYFTEEAKEELEQIIAWRRALHQIPEIGFDLTHTSAYVMEQLDTLGIPYKANIAETGIVALIEGSSGGKTVALRADMDALPIQEETGVSYASKNENMHACGHDAHTAMLLAAAKILHRHADDFAGTVKCIFQPAEETVGGAKYMIEEGVLESPPVDAILGLHVGNIAPGLEKGKVGVKAKAMMAASDVIDLTIKGSGCHGSAPHTGVDPITIASMVITALHTMMEREIKASEQAVLSFGSIEGGKVFNVIPDELRLKGLVRTFSPEIREYIRLRYEEIVASVSKMMKAEYILDYSQYYPALHNDPAVTEQFLKSAKKILPEEDIKVLEDPVMGAEDMAYFLEKVPGVFFFLGTNSEEKKIIYPNHNPKFNIDEQQLWKGPALLAQTALDLLSAN